MRQLGQYPPPRHVLAHLSDPHLLAGNVRQYGVVDTEAGLARVLERLAEVDPRPHALVFTGDLADRAEPDAYRRLREIVEPAAEAMGAEVVWTMGNHDEREPYARGLFGESGDRPQDRVHEVDGLRIVSLDTSVPGYHHGDLTHDQLAWLRDVLAEPAPHGTILAMHHPPLPLPMLPAAELIELLDQDRLAAVVEGTDVRGILAGHLHFSTWSTFAGVPVSVASASCYTSDPVPRPDRFVSGVDANQAFTMVHAYDDRLVHTIVPLEQGAEVTHVTLGTVAPMEDLELDQIHELASSKASPFNVGEV
ncbi:phosphodiesterase [Nocardioides seonyuensis]|uniref:Phosphodiesterase n=1 Tax=Nocardioides seonyuensis TaxID=2518371 RepID=A0A4P7IEA5_9ACTN|nr:metallophosphoesterase [Nocardioides seonyuensis]QBX54873.1 phosphodiesterase [Nocardioides seonyuensis]